MICEEFEMFSLVASVVVGLALVSALYGLVTERVEHSSQKAFASSSLGSKLEKISSEIWVK